MKSSKLAQEAINKARQEKKRRMADEPERKGKQKVKDEKSTKNIFLKIWIFSVILTSIVSLFSMIGSCSKLFQRPAIKQRPVARHKPTIKYENERSIEGKGENSYEIKKPETVTYRKKEIIKYFIYLKNGTRMTCKKIPELKNGMVVMTENHITTQIPASELAKIEGIRQ